MVGERSVSISLSRACNAMIEFPTDEFARCTFPDHIRIPHIESVCQGKVDEVDQESVPGAEHRRI